MKTHLFFFFVPFNIPGFHFRIADEMLQNRESLLYQNEIVSCLPSFWPDAEKPGRSPASF